MNAFADAWGHANNVRMWLGQAEHELREAIARSPSGSFGAVITLAGIAKIEEAISSLTKARLAWMDVAFWLDRARQACPPRPSTLEESFLQRLPVDFAFGCAMDEGFLTAKRAAILQEMAALDRLIAYLDQRQRMPA